jgi:protein phosphatase
MRDGREEVVPITADHRLTNHSERKRLAAMGIEMAEGRTRLYGLNLSRCLGDKFLKEEDLGLSAQPYTSPVVRFGKADSGMVVVATDGLWDVTNGSNVAQVLLRVRVVGFLWRCIVMDFADVAWASRL